MKGKWELHLLKNYGEMGTTFYLVPTIFYNHSKMFDLPGEDCSFSISLAWLFWEISLDRYWGSCYM